MIEDHGVTRMLHGRVLNGSHVIAFVRIVLPREVRFGVCRIDDTGGQLPGWRWKAAAAAAGRICKVLHWGLLRFVVAPDFAQVCIDEIDAPSSLLLDFVEDG